MKWNFKVNYTIRTVYLPDISNNGEFLLQLRHFVDPVVAHFLGMILEFLFLHYMKHRKSHRAGDWVTAVLK